MAKKTLINWINIVLLIIKGVPDLNERQWSLLNPEASYIKCHGYSIVFECFLRYDRGILSLLLMSGSG